MAWAEFPLYVSNKGISLASVVLIAMASLAYRRMPVDAMSREARRRLAKRCGLVGFSLLLLHSLLSLAILDGVHYPVLFVGGRMTTAGAICLLSGAFALCMFTVPAITSRRRFVETLKASRWKRAQQFVYLGLALTAVHALAVGVRNWPAFSTWPGGLPPISLLSFLICLGPIVAKIASVSRSSDIPKGPAQ